MDEQSLLRAAHEAHRAGKLDDAAAVYQKLLDRDAADADASYGLGTVRLQQGDAGSAVELLQRAAALEPAAPEIAFNLALALEQLPDIDRARVACLRAAALANGDAGLLVTICGKLLGLGLPQQAINALGACESDDRRVLALRARAQAATGDWGGAVAGLRRLKDMRPGDPGVWRSLAIAAGRLRDFDTALDAYGTYLSLKTPDADDLLAHADLLLMARASDEAGRVIDRVLESGDRRPQALFIAARCARLDGRYDRARDYLLEAIDKQPAFGTAWHLLLDTVDEEALPPLVARGSALLNEGAGTGRDRAPLALSVGRALERLERYEEAFRYFRLGNEEHRALLEADHRAYDPEASAAEFAQIRELFHTAPGRRAAAAGAARPVFIVGMPRSGTTLVERILTGLEGAEGGGELEAMEFVAAQYFWDLQKGRTAPPGELKDEQWAALAAEYAARVPATDGMLIDKMPHNARHLGLIAGMFPSAPIVHMRRDPRDVCLSIYARFFPDGHRYACDLEWLAHFHAQTAAIMEHWKAVLGEGILEIRYEDLVGDPEPVTRRIADFCGLRWTPDCLRFHERIEHSFTFSEMQVRQPLHAGGIGRWRRYERQLEPLLTALRGYGLA